MLGDSRTVVALVIASTLMLGVAPVQTGAATTMENPAGDDVETFSIGPDQGSCDTQHCVCGALQGFYGGMSLVCADAGSGSNGGSGGGGPFQL
jgi:hypothetical protein